MPIQSSMGQYKLDVRYGDRNSLPYYNGVLLSTLLADADALAAVTAGRVFSLTTGGFLVPGILTTAGATGGVVPLYSWSGMDENNYPDVKRDRGMPSFNGTAGSPFYGIPAGAGSVGGFVCIQHIAAAELSTTQFDTAATYTPGMALTCVIASASADKTIRGVLRPREQISDTIVGYVAAAGKFTGPEGYSTLAFTPAFVAGTTVPDTLVAGD